VLLASGRKARTRPDNAFIDVLVAVRSVFPRSENHDLRGYDFARLMISASCSPADDQVWEALRYLFVTEGKWLGLSTWGAAST